MTDTATSRAIVIVLSAVVAAVILFHRIGASDVCGGNEAVEAVFVQQMVEHGHVLFPVENGVTPMYKPPLFHWSALAIHRLAGIARVSAASLRATSAIYAIATVIIIAIFSTTMLGARAGVLAPAVLIAAYQFVLLGRFGRVDMTLAFFETLALVAFLRWMPARRGAREFDAPHLGMLYLMAIAMGLAVLAKGPAGAIIPASAIIVFMIVDGRAPQILAMLDPGALIVGAAIASSWYVACYAAGQTAFLNRQLGAENLGRFAGSLGSMRAAYYLKPIFLNSAPFSLIVPVAAIRALWRSKDSAPPVDDVRDARAGEAARLFAIFYLVTIAFFTVAAYKRRAYLLPVWPGAAYLLAWAAVYAIPARMREWTWRGFAIVCAALAVFNFVFIPRHEVASCGGDSLRPAAEDVARAIGADEPLYLYGFRDEIAPLLFYLDRTAPVYSGRLGDAPPGYLLMPEAAWNAHRGEALDLAPVMTSEHGNVNMVLVSRGKSYARWAF